MTSLVLDAPAPAASSLDFIPGDHICSLAHTAAEQDTLIAAYLQQGFDRGERVLYLGHAPSSDGIAAHLASLGVDVPSRLRDGQLVLRTAAETYLRDGSFLPERMFDFWDSELARATSDGFSVLRVTGETSWLRPDIPGADRFIEYEAQLNRILPGSRFIVLCQYDLGRCPAQRALDVLETHPLAVVDVEAYDNFFYVPPDALLGPEPVNARLEQWLHTLLHHRHRSPAIPASAPTDSARVLQEQQRELEEFVSITSHHLREPLRKLRILSDALLQQDSENLAPAARDLLRRIQNAAWRATDQLDGLREYASVHRHRGVLPAVNLDRILHTVLLDMRDILQQTGARVDLAPLPTLCAEPGQMRTLFRHLLANALLYRSPGVPPVVTISAAQACGFHVITVQDNGLGFEPELVDRIFRPFELPHHPAPPLRPTALGLTICRKIALAHGGAISATSVPGCATRVIIRLPDFAPELPPALSASN